MIELKTVSVTKARQNIYSLMDRTIEESEPVQITGRRGDVIMISLEDWNAIQETLHLVSIPGMEQSIIEGMNESLDECGTPEDIGWDI